MTWRSGRALHNLTRQTPESAYGTVVADENDNKEINDGSGRNPTASGHGTDHAGILETPETRPTLPVLRYEQKRIEHAHFAVPTKRQ